MYQGLVSDAKEQCHRRGQQSWCQTNGSTIAIKHARDLEEDFAYLQTKMQDTVQRTEKNISLLMALVAIGEGKQGLHKNHAIARITLVATVFLPFSTVAAVLGMQGSFAPGADGFWIFWVVAIPLTAFIIGFFALYDGFGQQILNKSKSLVLHKWCMFHSQSPEHGRVQCMQTEKNSLPLAASWKGKSWPEQECDMPQASRGLPTMADAV
jgi:hypothetical protein